MHLKKTPKRVITAIVSAGVLICAFPAFTSVMADNSFEIMVTYLTGTDDSVVNMPAEAVVGLGNVYTVPSELPEREGYEFIEWILEWEEQNPVTTAGYVVRYVDADGNPIAEDKEVRDLAIGTEVTESAISVDGYRMPNNADQSITLVNGINEIVFVYEKNITWRVTYDLNGGYGTTPVDNTEYSAGDFATIAAEFNIDNDDGWFTGCWSTTPLPILAPDAFNVTDYYQIGDVYEMGESDVTFYAVYIGLTD